MCTTDEAIWRCNKAVIIISNSVVKSTKYEREQWVIQSLVARQWDVKKNLILPLLLGVSVDKYRRHYPTLANIKPLEVNLLSPDCIALQLLKHLGIEYLQNEYCKWSSQLCLL